MSDIRSTRLLALAVLGGALAFAGCVGEDVQREDQSSEPTETGEVAGDEAPDPVDGVSTDQAGIDANDQSTTDG